MCRKAAVAVALLFLWIFGAAAPAAPAAAANPLTGGAPAAAEAREEAGFWRRTVFYIQRQQASLQRDLSAAVRQLKSAESTAPLVTLVLLAFFYGIFHAAGPGHGKVVISSYLLAREDRIKQGVKLAVLSSFVQALSAIALVGLLAVALDLSRLETTDKVRWLEIVSYGLIIAVGLWMLRGALRGQGCGHDHHGHHHGPQAHIKANPDDDSRRMSGGLGHMAAVVFAIGIRPCSGAIIVLLFALAQGIFLAGVGATFAMAAGTAITVSALALLTVLSRRMAVRIAGSGSKWEGWINSGLAVTGSLAVTFFGALLLYAALAQPVRPI